MTVSMAPLSIAIGSAYAAHMQQPMHAAEDDGALARKIITAAPGTDAAAEAELCRRFAPRIRMYGLRHLRSDAAAADLVQDVLILTLQKLRGGAVREPERIASFILGTSRQQVIDGRRGGTRRERILDTFSAEFAASVEAATDVLDADRLHHCMEWLPERERTILFMSFYDDRPADEVGRELGLSSGNVRVIRHRAIDRLKVCMQLEEAAR
jgi:RNA polymerase sigma-70 factor (ECF subfamily)